ncbi:hypothetical protein NQ314_011759, partial [Rhamnusium bicolor]
MSQALKPENFEKVVSYTRKISGYNESTKTFRAPSLALHFRTVLLAICQTATTLLIKNDPILELDNHKEVLNDVIQFNALVSHKWKFEMGSLALKDLTEKNSLHPQKLPIANDIILFNTHYIGAFRKLSETLIALAISLNQKELDVQYTKIELYNSATNKQEDCLNILTEGEREITKHFKRILTVGKGSRAVAILFPKKIQNYIEFMLEIREKTFVVPHENPYLFALIDCLKNFQTSKIAKLLSTLMHKSLNKEDQGKTIEEIDAEINTWESNEIEKDA